MVAAAPSVIPGALPAVTVPTSASPRSSRDREREDRLQARERLGRGVPPRVLVRVNDRLATLGVTDRDRGQLVGESTVVDRREGPPMALERECVLVLAADVLADRDALGVGTHVAVLDRAPQAVVDRGVDERRVTEPEPEPRSRNEIRCEVHVLHAARDGDLRVAGPDLGGREHDRLEPGAADAVDRRGRGRLGETAEQGRLARRAPVRHPPAAPGP